MSEQNQNQQKVRMHKQPNRHWILAFVSVLKINITITIFYMNLSYGVLQYENAMQDEHE